MAECDVILIVDDNPDLRDGLRVVLAKEGYTVETARNGRDALSRLYGGLRPCLIILDLMMPVMNGFEFREAQLADARLADIPLIAYSGVTDPRETALQLRAAAYVHKPAEAEELAVLVRRFCPKDAAP